MARERLTVIIGKVEDFEVLNIDLKDCRNSVNGTQAVKHIEHLSSIDYNNILIDVRQYGSTFYFIGDASLQALMQTPDWVEADEI